MKKSKKILFVGIGVIILIIILGTLLFILVNRNNEEDEEKNNTVINEVDAKEKETTENLQEVDDVSNLILESDSVYVCKIAFDEEDNNTSIKVLYYYVSEGVVLAETSTLEITYTDEEVYNNIKEDNENNDDYQFYDDKLLVIMKDGLYKDLTIDIYGNDMELAYKTQRTSLESIGYVCEKIE